MIRAATAPPAAAVLVLRNTIATELLKSDVWLYPTDFSETYCIAALEAQAAGLLCASTGLAALTEIIGDRGIVVGDDITDPSTESELHDSLIHTLKNIDQKTKLQDKARKWALTQNHLSLATKWKKELFPL